MTKSHHIAPPITYRLKVLHIRYTHLSKLEAQYPDIETSSQSLSYSRSVYKPKNSAKSRPFSVFSSMSANTTTATSSKTGSSATLASSSNDVTTTSSSKNKMQFKYRTMITTEEEILPGA